MQYIGSLNIQTLILKKSIQKLFLETVRNTRNLWTLKLSEKIKRYETYLMEHGKKEVHKMQL